MSSPNRSLVSTLARLFLMALAAVSMNACAPKQTPGDPKRETRTGGVLPDGPEFTGAGQSALLARLKKKISQADGSNFALASAIKTISVQKLDRKGAVVPEFPSRLMI